MASVRDLIDYVKAVDHLHIEIDLYWKTKLINDYAKNAPLPGNLTVSQYLDKRVKPCLPRGTAITVFDSAGRVVNPAALIDNIRIRQAAAKPSFFRS